MPKAPKVCGFPGCANLTTRAQCVTHQRAEQNADALLYRNPAKQKVYRSKRWRALRRSQLARASWCQAPGCVNAAMEVDHITDFTDGHDPRAWDPANLQSLCKMHHSEKTMRSAFGRKEKSA